MKELIIEFGSENLGEIRMYPRNPKGYEQAIKDMQLYKAQQKAEIEYLKTKITAECKEHQETMKVTEKTIRLLEKALELCAKKLLSIYCCEYCGDTANCGKTECEFEQKCSANYFKTKAEEMLNEINND